MKITEVVCQILRIPNVEAKTASSQDSVLVRVRTDTGLEGIGEADSSPEVVKAIIDAPFSHNIACGLRQIARRREPAGARAAVAEDVPPHDVLRPHGRSTITAMAAIDMALWDLKGKHFGEPIHRLLGGKQHDRIPAYASILFGKRRQRDRATSPGAGARPATRRSSSAGSRWARARRSTSTWCAAPARASATTARC